MEDKGKLGIDELLSNTESVEKAEEKTEKEINKSASDKTDDSGKLFKKFKIKDIVFLAIMAAVMLVTGSIMPLVGQIPVFGIVQVCLGIQFSLFPTIGMMKVRKPGALFFVSVFCGAVLLFMNTIMFFVTILCSIVAEGLTLLIFRGYDKDAACLFAGTVYFPATLPLLYIYYRFLYTMTGEEGESVTAMIGSSPAVAIGMSAAVIAICFVGALLGVIISKELKKSGVMKK